MSLLNHLPFHKDPKQEAAYDIMNNAAVALDNAICECVSSLDVDGLIDAGKAILGENHPAIEDLILYKNHYEELCND